MLGLGYESCELDLVLLGWLGLCWIVWALVPLRGKIQQYLSLVLHWWMVGSSYSSDSGSWMGRGTSQGCRGHPMSLAVEVFHALILLFLQVPGVFCCNRTRLRYTCMLRVSDGFSRLTLDST